MRVAKDIAQGLLWIAGMMFGIALVAADFDYAGWIETLLGAAGIWLMVSCTVRAFPEGIWPFNTEVSK
jgi:hypothetical protein